MGASHAELKAFLDAKVAVFNQPSFIPEDPISIPHSYRHRGDQEVMGFFAAILAWGQRVTILNKCRELDDLFSGSPQAFIRDHSPAERRQVSQQFVHRTFNAQDFDWFLQRLQRIYQQEGSLEPLFAPKAGEETVEGALIRFHEAFFDRPEAPARTRKHVATPARGSACKRLNMFLRWMVRKDEAGVDLGLWTALSPAQLVCPLDLHVSRVARKLGLLTRKQDDWQAALELTAHLRRLDPTDPVKYDLALFGLGVVEKFWAED